NIIFLFLFYFESFSPVAYSQVNTASLLPKFKESSFIFDLNQKNSMLDSIIKASQYIIIGETHRDEAATNFQFNFYEYLFTNYNYKIWLMERPPSYVYLVKEYFLTGDSSWL